MASGRPPWPGPNILHRTLQDDRNGLLYGMPLPFVRWIRPGIFGLLCFWLAGCAMEVAPYGPTQSMEAAVQTVLTKQGYYQGPIDGSIGPATSRAIRDYQRDHHLTTTGTINPALLSSMGLVAPSVGYGSAPYYTGYSSYYTGPAYYSAPVYYAPPPVAVGFGWGGGWPRYWGGGCGGYGGYRGYGGYGGYRGYGGWCR